MKFGAQIHYLFCGIKGYFERVNFLFVLRFTRGSMVMSMLLLLSLFWERLSPMLELFARFLGLARGESCDQLLKQKHVVVSEITAWLFRKVHQGEELCCNLLKTHTHTCFNVLVTSV